MDFVSARIITGDVARLAGFYERATGVQASRPNENFADLATASATLAIASTRTVPLLAPRHRPPGRQPHCHHRVPRRRRGRRAPETGRLVEDFINEPAMMPRGNRSLLFRDPDGNLVNRIETGR